MPDSMHNAQLNIELAGKFREAANHLDKCTPLGLLDVKLFLLSALNDTDRALDYGNPGAGINQLLTEEHTHHG